VEEKHCMQCFHPLLVFQFNSLVTKMTYTLKTCLMFLERL